MHCLSFYLLEIAKSAFEQHQLGIGIFTMQGFEGRDKESKNTLKIFYNGKGLVMAQNMRGLNDVFCPSQDLFKIKKKLIINGKGSKINFKHYDLINLTAIILFVLSSMTRFKVI